MEVCCDYNFVDIAAEGFDAGVRLGEDVAEGMIATRIGLDMRMSVVGSPAYLATRALPQTPRDLVQHQCNNLRLPTNGGLYAWEFKKDNEALNVSVSGQITYNDVYHLLDAALDGFGLSYVPTDIVAPYVADGRLIRVLEDWSPQFPGFHLIIQTDARHPLHLHSWWTHCVTEDSAFTLSGNHPAGDCSRRVAQ